MSIQSGRTTRLTIRAKHYAAKGDKVLVIFYNQKECIKWSVQLQNAGDDHPITAATLSMAKRGGARYDTVLIDHYLLEQSDTGQHRILPGIQMELMKSGSCDVITDESGAVVSIVKTKPDGDDALKIAVAMAKITTPSKSTESEKVGRMRARNASYEMGFDKSMREEIAKRQKEKGIDPAQYQPSQPMVESQPGIGAPKQVDLSSLADKLDIAKLMPFSFGKIAAMAAKAQHYCDHHWKPVAIDPFKQITTYQCDKCNSACDQSDKDRINNKPIG